MSEFAKLPDKFDRMLTSVHGVPETLRSRQAQHRQIDPLMGVSESWSVQTYRQQVPRLDKKTGQPKTDKDGRDVLMSEDLIFIECKDAEGYKRFALPPAVANLIAQQREQLNSKSRQRAAKKRRDALRVASS